MIGIIPSTSKTFIVEGYINNEKPIEGRLYIDKKTGRVYMYSLVEVRSNPQTGYFPIWNGREYLVTPFSNKKYLDNDVCQTDVSLMCKKIDSTTAEKIKYDHRKSENDDILDPQISDGDNMFTQCIKGILKVKQFTMIDLMDKSSSNLDEKTLTNFYSALTKTTFMRLDRWSVWMDMILHMGYIVTIFKDEKRLIAYEYPGDHFDTGIVKYDKIIESGEDPFKKLIKILIIMENITKNSLRSDEIDDYTINNMLTTLNGKKSLSSQLFGRFLRMAKLTYTVDIFEGNDMIFQYREN